MNDALFARVGIQIVAENHGGTIGLLLEAKPQPFLCAKSLNEGERRLVILSHVLAALVFAAKLHKIEIHAKAIAVVAQCIGDDFHDGLHLEQPAFAGAGEIRDPGTSTTR